MHSERRPDTAELRWLAANFGSEPRSIMAVIEGRNVRGLAGQRATAAADEWRRRVAAGIPCAGPLPGAAVRS